MAIKDLKEFRLRRERQMVEGAEAMADYKKAQRAKFDRLVQLRTERTIREAASGPPKAEVSKAKPARKTKKPK